ncbi:cysteine protease StiP domain-containing protein [Psychrobacter aestuarii]|uniref:Tellurite-like stress resistance cysteine protease StiP n=1 Tax=Psychrobacter aestuarii TaxID=556327 RepID=A0ABP3FCF5_9GAMM|nr:cysteine protease StiP domain-containing protein [Psychrobacter aestuarii]
MTIDPTADVTPCLSGYGSGSYPQEDVTLLLDIVDKDAISDVPVDKKEALIQSGQRHYSDMLTLERAPSAIHEALYQEALDAGGARMATDIANLAHTLHQLFANDTSAQTPLVLISLVRAGLPVGVLLQRALRDRDADYALPSVHYGMSIIRDRGLDANALTQILTQHKGSKLVFVDGWTGKGAIYGELERSLAAYQDPAHPHFAAIFHQGADVVPLLTLADPAGVAWLSASTDDWLIPSGLLNSTVSGLVSRSLYTAPEAGVHRAVMYDDLSEHDHSRAFIEHIDALRPQHNGLHRLPTYDAPRYSTALIVKKIASEQQIDNPNRIKPTIAEATRAILRRDPEQVLLANAEHPDTKLLRHLCAQQRITVTIAGTEILPYQAITIIKSRSKD